MARFGARAYTVGMDGDRQTAMRRRADEAMAAALAAADDCPPALAVFLEDAMASIDLACRDATLDRRDRLALIDDALRLVATLRKLLGTPGAGRHDLIMEVFRGTNGLLCRYARCVRAERPGS